MNYAKIWLAAGLMSGLLAGCGTYRDPNYEKFTLSVPERSAADEARARLRSTRPIEETSKSFTDTLMPAEIATIQSFLNANGFVAGLENGSFNARTGTAIRAYQRANRLDVTGEPDEALLDAAYAYFNDPIPYNPAREAFTAGEWGTDNADTDDDPQAEDGQDSGDWVTPQF